MYKLLTARQKEAYDYQAEATGIPAEEILATLVNDKAEEFYRGMIYVKTKDVIDKVLANPDAYIKMINDKATEMEKI